MQEAEWKFEKKFNNEEKMRKIIKIRVNEGILGKGCGRKLGPVSKRYEIREVFRFLHSTNKLLISS